jgi:hypothetical protein
MSSSKLDTNGPVVALFGPLSPSLSQSNFTTLRATVLASPQHAWVEQALASLPAHYESLVTECPDLHNEASEGSIVDLAAWLRTGSLKLDRQQLPNSLLAPLIVISQLVQYRAFLDIRHAAQEQPMVKETVGFCIGLLSAFTVSLSHGSSASVYAQNAGVALRLAMLAGCIVDRQQMQDARGPSRTISVAWKRVDSRDNCKELKIILAKYSDVSVPYRYQARRFLSYFPLSV